MFQLALLKDTVRVAPSCFGKDFKQAIIDELNGKYANRIVYSLGLCICIFDLVKMDDPIVHPGEGAAIVKGTPSTILTKVQFRMVLFRPFLGEMIVGKVASCDEDGIRVSVGFFDDIFIPVSCMKAGTVFDVNERLWVWNYEENELFIDVDEPIRIRVAAERFVEVPPVEKDLLYTVNAGNAAEGAVKEYSKKIPAYVVTASVVEDGLGLISWWQQSVPIDEE